MVAQRTCAGVHVVKFDLQKAIDTNVKHCSQASRLKAGIKASSLAYNPQCKQRRYNKCVLPTSSNNSFLTLTSSLYILRGCNNMAQFVSPSLFIRHTPQLRDNGRILLSICPSKFAFQPDC